MSDKTMMLTATITSLTALVGAGTVFVKKLKDFKKAILNLEEALFHAHGRNQELTQQLAKSQTPAKKATATKKAAPKKEA
jgi:Tfp pilus assembly protein PilN